MIYNINYLEYTLALWSIFSIEPYEKARIAQTFCLR